MVYSGTYAIEAIEFSYVSNPAEKHHIELIKFADTPTFGVSSCCGGDWYYEFLMEGNSDYERVKMAIMDTIFECETVEELLDELSGLFEDGFSDILIEDDDCDECNGCCGGCNKYMN